MKRIALIVSMFLVIACDTENALDCFQRTGDIITQEVEVADFTRILVNPGVELILKEGETTSVIIETGDNLLNEVSAIVEGGRLILSNANDCNFVKLKFLLRHLILQKSEVQHSLIFLQMEF